MMAGATIILRQTTKCTRPYQLYPGLRTLWETPPLYVVDDFFTAPECDALMALASNYMIASPVVGAGAGEVSESRTSSSCFLAREDLPTVCSKVMALTGKPIEHLELPQVGWGWVTAWGPGGRFFPPCPAWRVSSCTETIDAPWRRS